MCGTVITMPAFIILCPYNSIDFSPITFYKVHEYRAGHMRVYGKLDINGT